MPGIRVDTPRGTGWEYSLDNVAWQPSRIFAAMPDGTAFVVGQAYEVTCRNLLQQKETKAVIVFGEPTNNGFIGLQNASEGDIFTVKIIDGERYLTVISRQALTANILSQIASFPSLRAQFCALMSGCGDGDTIEWVILDQFEEVPQEGEDTIEWIILDQFVEAEVTPMPTGIFRIVGPARVVEGAAGQYSVEQKLTDDSWLAYTGAVTWSTVGAPAGSTILSGLLTVPIDTITADLTIAVHAAVLSSVVEQSIILTNVASSIVGYHISGPGTLTEGTTSANYSIITDYADGSTLVYIGAGNYSVPGDTSGITINGGTNATITLTSPANSITADRTLTLRFGVPGFGNIQKSITLTNITPAPTITGYHIDGPDTLIEGTTSANYSLIVDYSDGSTQVYSGAGAYGIPGDAKGTIINNVSAGVTKLTLPANSISQDELIVLRFTFVPSGIIGKEIALSNVAPAISSYSIPDTTILEGTSQTVRITIHYSDGSTALYAGAGTFSILTPYPPDMTVSTNTGAALISVAANSVTADVPLTLRFTFPGGTTLDGNLLVQNVAPLAPAVAKFALRIVGVNSTASSYYDVELLYKTNLSVGTQLEDCWTEYWAITSQTPEFVPSNVVDNPSSFPTGFQDYNVVMSYLMPISVTSSHSTQHIKVRQAGTTTLLLDTTFDPFGMTNGQTKQFIP